MSFSATMNELQTTLTQVLFVILVIRHPDGFLSSASSLLANPSFPCVFEDHLVTDRNWYGYLANITVMTTGRLTFEFSYPADRCCQNILFYSEDQMSIINARMNCWQKEYLLRPEDDQILRLTPRFSWSGCHMTHPNDIATYVCKGGRSFTVEQPRDRPSTWYIAASNCNTAQGLDLDYRMEIFGHIGECRSSNGGADDQGGPAGGDLPPSGIGGSSGAVLQSSRAGGQDVTARDASSSSSSASSESVCVLEGDVNTTANWYGFIANVSVLAGGGFAYRFTYPYNMQIQNVVLYNEDEVVKLGWDRSCWQKEGLVQSHLVPEQIIDLSYRSSWNGCVSKNSSYGRSLTCQGERRFDKARHLFVAVSNCRTVNGLLLNYRFEVFGYDADMCSSAALALPPVGALGASFAVCLWIAATGFLMMTPTRQLSSI